MLPKPNHFLKQILFAVQDPQLSIMKQARKEVEWWGSERAGKMVCGAHMWSPREPWRHSPSPSDS